MEPTILPGEIVIGFRPPFGLVLPGFGRLSQGRPPRRGELVVLKCPTGLCLKRIMGLPGDRIEMQRQRVVLNSHPCLYKKNSELLSQALLGQVAVQTADSQHVKIQESCLDGPTHDLQISQEWSDESWGPHIIEPGRVFVLNDNRAQGDDSRQWGPLRMDEIQAQAKLIWLSLNWQTDNGESWLRHRRSFLHIN
jgi:signal peptidase I